MANVDRFSLTLPPELGEAIRSAASRQSRSVSSWLADAASDRLRNELLGAALDEWERADGAFTDSELAAAARTLDAAPRRRRPSGIA